jgi:UDP-N-acetylglucosamine 2-epimerase (non-hydrolysing)
MTLALVFGTRPEIIKMSPVIRECERLHLDFFLVHTGQHYSYEMDKVFFEQLELPEPWFHLDVGSGSHAEQTSRILVGTEKVLREIQPTMVLVQGDTNSTLAGALASVKLHFAVGHVEAGLRSYDRTMPEEINRVLTDHCADLLFAPTEKSKGILLGEGIAPEHVFVTGNTIADAVMQHLRLADKKVNVFTELGLNKNEYVLATVHRQENVDDHQRFQSILKGLRLLHRELDLPVVYPMHPRARKMAQKFDVSLDGIHVVDPVDFLRFLQLEEHARVVMTDSGGVQEESCILGVPCVTLRDNTERPETLEVGANMLAGTEPERILQCTVAMMDARRSWESPFGDGTAGKQIVRHVREAVA